MLIDEKQFSKIIGNKKRELLIKVREGYQDFCQKEENKLSRKNSQLTDDGNEGNLIKQLQKKLQGNYQTLAVSLFYSPEELDAVKIGESLGETGLDENALIDIIGTSNIQQLEKIKKFYKQIYKTELEQEIEGEIRGTFQKLLIRLLKCDRSQNKNPDIRSCEAKAKKLKENGNGNEDLFIEIFSKSSRNELKYICQFYYNLTGESIFSLLDKQFDNHQETNKLFKAILYGLLNPSEYFSDKIKESLKGIGTDDKSLIRLISSRNEIDMDKIKKFYSKKYKKNIREDICSDTVGEYKNLLLCLLDKMENKEYN